MPPVCVSVAPSAMVIGPLMVAALLLGVPFSLLILLLPDSARMAMPAAYDAVA